MISFRNKHWHDISISFAGLLIISILISPFGHIFVPTTVNAATFTTTWTAQADFENNNVSGEGATTITNASTTASVGDVTLELQGSDVTFTDTFDNTTYKDSDSTATWTGDGGISVPAASSTDLRPQVYGVYGMSVDPLSAVYSTSTGMIYSAYYNGILIGYNPSTGTSTDLTDTIRSVWGTTHTYSLTFDSTNNVLYLGGSNGKFASYNTSSETVTDLTSKVSSFWSTSYMYSLTFDSTNNIIYIGGSNGKFASYDPSTETATDLTSKISSFWSTSTVYDLTFDSTNNILYLGGASGKFASYNPSTETATDLISKISSFWSTQNVHELVFDATNSIIYLGGASRNFASYDPSVASSTDLESKITSSWYQNTTIEAMALDSTNGVLYLGGNGEFGSYNISGDAWTNLTSKVSDFFASTSYDTLYTMIFDSVNSIIYSNGDDGRTFSYNPSTATATNLSGVFSSYMYGSALVTWKDSTLDSTNNILYLIGGTYGGPLFASYDPSTGTLTDLSSKVSSYWSIYAGGLSATFDSTNNIVYIGGSRSEFTSYDPSTETVTDLGIKLSSFIGGNSDYVKALTFDSTNDIIYVGDYGGEFGSYNPATETATDLTSKISSFWGSDNIMELAFDTTNNIIYIGGGPSGRFASYDPSTETATDLTSKITSFWGTSNAYVNGFAFDSTNNIMYLGGNNEKFASYDPSTETITDLSSKIASFWSSGTIEAAIFDSAEDTVYVAGSRGLASYNPSEDTSTDLDSVVTYDWGTLGANTMTFDSINNSSYIAGSSGAFSIVQAFSSATAESTIIDSLSTGIAYATLTGSDTPGSGTVTYSMSNDNGTTWAEVTSGSQYDFTTASSSLKWKVVLTGDATIESVSITYNGYQSTGNITILKEDAGGDAQWTNIAWTETTPGNTLVKFRTRGVTTAEGEGALTSESWSPWYTASSTITDEASSPNPSYRWIEVEMYLDSSTDAGAFTPTLSDFTLTYVINGAPDFNNDYPTTGDGGSTATQNSTTDHADWGQVEISYAVRDTDSTSGDSTPGFVTPSFEYDIGSGWVSATGFASGDTDNKTVDESAYNTYTATWDAPTQLAGTYSASTSIRVTANDNETLNNTASTSTAPFELDAKAPTVTTFTLNSATDVVNLNLTDDTNISYKLSNESDLSADGSNASSGTWQVVGDTSISTAVAWVYSSDRIVYLQVRDAYGNVTANNATAPDGLSSVDLKDISNAVNEDYREFISWAPYTSTSSATFTNYTIYRSTDGSSYSSLTTITDIDTNYYADTSLTTGTTYYYKIVVVDSDSDTSDYSTVASDDPDGQGGTDLTAPSISSITTATTEATWATITWTTDELANSTVEYSTVAAGDYASSVSSVSFVTSHSIGITGLTPATDYVYRVKSIDTAANSTTDDNSSSGYTFTSASGPAISDVATETINDESADIIWNTDADADSYVVYASSAANLAADTNTTEVGSATLVGGSGPNYQHRVSVTSLTTRTTYYYYVKSTDGSSNTVTDTNGGDYYSFTTTYDDVPPVISNISTPVKTASSIVVLWQTDELATSKLIYGAESGSLTSSTTLDSTLSIAHIATIPDLSELSTYYYQLVSADGEGNQATSSEQTATTTSAIEVQIQYVGGGGAVAPSDTLSPVITNVEVEDVGAFEATVTFNTNEDSTGFVEYGLDSNYTKRTGSPSFTTKHNLKLDGLKLGTKYVLRAKANDKFGNTGISDEISFTTLFASENLDDLINLENAALFQDELDGILESILPSLVPPFISNVTINAVTENTAIASWDTNVSTFGNVAYATDAEYDAEATNPYSTELGSLDKGKNKNHNMNLGNLTPRTKYHLQVKSFVFPGVLSKSEDIVFFTSASKIKPEIAKLGNTEVEIRWITDVPTNSYIELRNLTTGQTTQLNDVTYVKNHSILAENLAPRTTYNVRVFGYDSDNNIVEGDAISVRTKADIIPPVISGIEINSALIPGKTDRLQTVISWKTDEETNSIVYFEQGVGTEDVKLNQAGQLEDATLNHTVILTALRPQTVYRFKVVSEDSAGNRTSSPIRTILTPHSDKSIVDIIFKNFQDSFGFLEGI